VLHPYYVYVLCRDEDCLDPFYIGKGIKDRWSSHEIDALRSTRFRTRKDQTIRSVVARVGFVPKFKFAENLSSEEAFLVEEWLIDFFGRLDMGTGPLTNCSSGGNQGPSRKGIRSEANSLAAKKRLEDPVFRGKFFSAAAESSRRPDVRAASSERMKQLWQNPEFRSRKTAQFKTVVNVLWNDPEFRSAHTGENHHWYGKSARSSEELSVWNRERWQDPVYREMKSKDNRRIALERMSNPETRKRTIDAVIASNKRRAGNKRSPEATAKALETRRKSAETRGCW
jgi:hypothetical protein